MNFADITMLVPGMVAILLTIISRDSLRDLFKLGSSKNAILGIVASCSAFAVFLLIVYGFSLTTFGIQSRALNFFLGHHGDATFGFPLWGILYWLGYTFFTATFEEIGWRGYLLKKLGEKLNSFWRRAFIVGVVWGIWHLPVYPVDVFGGQVITMTAILIMLIFVINMTLLSVIYTWLFEKQRSIWPSSFAHTSHNLLFNYVFYMITIKHPTPGRSIVWGEGGLLMMASYLVVIIIGYFIIRSRKVQPQKTM